MDYSERFKPFAAKMTAEGLPEIAIRTFAHYYEQLVAGQTGMIGEGDIEPVASLPDADEFGDALAEIGRGTLGQTLLLKLNGGLGTSMGLQKAKSLLPIKDGLTFLDVIAQQALASGIPLVLMNSFNTQADSLEALRPYTDLWGALPLDFVQNKVPKVRQDDFGLAENPENEHLGWNPPGHGDIYTALVTSGLLDKLLDAGYGYAFVSNSDNLGAVMDVAILGYFVQNGLPFMMEVADRTEADKKGGHLAQQNGRLILRELAQTPAEDIEAFQDVGRHKYFNTNNLWLNLPELKRILEANNHILGLPMIRNSKTLDPRDPTSTPVYQLETAMGSAIGIFEGAGAVRVNRGRFAPVKTTADLLAVRSDAYVLTDDYRIVHNPARTADTLTITLDNAYYKLIDEMEAHFPHGIPSLLEARSLTVKGEVFFGRNVKIKGNVAVTNSGEEPLWIGDGVTLKG